MAPWVEWYHSSNVKVMSSNTAVRTVIFVVVVVSGLFVIPSIAFVTVRLMSFFIQKFLYYFTLVFRLFSSETGIVTVTLQQVP